MAVLGHSLNFIFYLHLISPYRQFLEGKLIFEISMDLFPLLLLFFIPSVWCTTLFKIFPCIWVILSIPIDMQIQIKNISDFSEQEVEILA